MKILLFPLVHTVVVLLAVPTIKTLECQNNSTSCIDQHHYQQCTNNQTETITACPDGTVCDHTSGTAICRNIDPLAPLESPIEVPKCTRHSKHPALLCYQYHECVPTWWWYTLELKSCPQGQAYDRYSESCVCAGAVGCELPDSKTVECTGPGNIAATECHQYYKCTKVLWFWISLLKKCPDGQVYDKATCQCASDQEVKCFDPVPQCQGYGLWPAPDKRQYYECVVSDSGVGWVATLRMCPPGLVFKPSSERCVLRLF